MDNVDKLCAIFQEALSFLEDDELYELRLHHP